ncbi:long-chain fatty acid--CoA ligase [Pseudonocardia ailaonensis]|uniref:Long-chain fatty acid--CoA ligase n=1 Tax=Pseudonocardia ailaonensis TaxID=367279 RepID=A0ABN2N418_9PSEU
MEIDCNRNVFSVLAELATQRPDVEALSFYGARWTFGDLETAALRIARGLRARGVREGDTVGAVLGNTPESVMVCFAAARLGAILVPMSEGATTHEVEKLVRAARTDVLVAATPDPSAAAAAAERLGVRCFVVLDRTAADPLAAVDAVDGGTDELPAPVPADRPFVVWFSSGTTGEPKGSVQTHEGFLLNNIGKWIRKVPIGPDDVSLVFLPLGHTGGGMAWGTILLGGSAKLLAKPSTSEIVESLEKGEGSYLIGSATIFRMVVRLGRERGLESFPSVRKVIVGAAPVSTELLAELAVAFPAAEIFQGYGASEGNISVCSLSETPHKNHTVGVPFPGVEVRLLGADRRPVPVGEIGEVEIRGPGIIRRYFHQPEPDGEPPWIPLNDLAAFDEDGYLRIAGRQGDIIISGGFNVMAIEVESVLHQHPAVAACAVVGRDDERLGEKVVAFVLPTEGTDADGLEAALGAYCAERLTRYKVPREIRVIDTMPRTALGKIRKHLLPA